MWHSGLAPIFVIVLIILPSLNPSLFVYLSWGFLYVFVLFLYHKIYHFKKSLLNTQITANQPLLPNGTRVSQPIAAVFSMSPLCIWAVHMFQGVHVWSLHGSISWTHWSTLHLCILRINKKNNKGKKKLSGVYKPVQTTLAVQRTSDAD